MWRPSGQVEPLLQRTLTPLSIVCAALMLASVPAVTRIVLTVPLHLSLNYNEGWNAYHVMQILHGDSVYADAGGFFFNNYPPLSFYLIAGLTRVLPDPIVAGRCVSLVAFMVWTIALVRTAFVFGCRRDQALFAALLFGATTLLFTDYVGMNDPQMLAHAVAGLGLLAIIPAPRTAGRLLAGAIMLSAAVFIKHNLIALPVACTVWLALTDRQSGRRLVAIGACCAVAGATASAAMSGLSLFRDLGQPRAYLPPKAISMAMEWGARWALALVLLTFTRRRWLDDSAVLFCSIYVAVAGALGLALSGGEGINSNVLFDANWAVCLSAGVVLNRRQPNEGTASGRDWTMGMVAAYLLVPVIAVSVGGRQEWASASYWLAPRSAEAADSARGIDFLAHSEGRALCEDLALCFWAGKPAEVDVFNTQQNVRSGRVAADVLVRLIDARHYGAVQLASFPREIDPRVTEALRRRYRIHHRDASGSYLEPQ